MIWSISVKIAVFAPIPSASESTATLAKSGLRDNPRNAYFKSAKMFPMIPPRKLTIRRE